MKAFEERDRYVGLNLTPESVVLDIGAHVGGFAAEISKLYGCVIHCYEPVPRFYNECVRRFADNPKIVLWPYALGNSNRKESFGIKGDMSGAFCPTPNEHEDVPVRDVVEVFSMLSQPEISLAKINAEGAEFELLEALLDNGLIARINILHVQPHALFAGAEERWAAIKNRMLITHELTFASDWCWFGWTRKP